MSERWTVEEINLHLDRLSGGYGAREASAQVIEQLIADLAASEGNVCYWRQKYEDLFRDCERIGADLAAAEKARDELQDYR